MKETVEVDELWQVHETEKAVLIRTIDDQELWIPKSQIEYIELNFKY